MLNQDFEIYIKENLESAKTSWDKEAMWIDIEKELPKKEKKKSWLFFLLGFLLLSSILYIVIENYNKDRPKIEVIIDNDSALAQDVNIEETPLNIQSDNTELNKKDIADLNSGNILISDNKTIIEKSILTHKSNNKKEIKVTQPTNRNKNKATIVSVDKKEIKVIQDSQTVSDVSQTTLNSNSETNLISRESIALLGAIKKLDQQSIGLIKPFIRVELSLNFVQPKEIIVVKNQIPRFSISLMGSGGLLSKRMDGNNEELLALRTTSEKPLEAVGVNLLFNYEINSNLFLRSGLDYRTITEKTNNEIEEVDIRSVQSDSAIIYNFSNGNTSFGFGELESRTTRINQHIRYPKHHFINVPLHIGYQNNLAKNLKVNLYSGPVFNIAHAFDGDVINAENQFTGEENIDLQKSSLLYAVDLGAGINYGFTNNWGLNLGFNYRLATSKFSLDESVYQSYNIMEFQLGLFYKL